MTALLRITPRQLAMAAALLYIVLQVLALTLPCRTYGYIAAATLIPFALFAIAVTGTERTRPDISDRVRAFMLFLALCCLDAGPAAAFGAIC